MCRVCNNGTTTNNKGIKCSKCGVAWHPTKHHNTAVAKTGAIQTHYDNVSAMLGSNGGQTGWIDSEGLVTQTFCFDEPVTISQAQLNEIAKDSLILEHSETHIKIQKTLAEFADKTQKELDWERLSPYHKKFINDPEYQWVNCCQMYVKKSRIAECGGRCPYHQYVLADGSLAYDELNQDGEK